MSRERLVTYRTRVPRDWVDYNGHLNVGYYMIAFDKATDGLADALGIGLAYRNDHDCSIYVVDAHLCFEREVMEAAPIRIETLLVGADDKRIHAIHSMIEETSGQLAATAELLILHVDLSTRRAAAFPPDRAQAIGALARAHAGLARPPQLGRTVALRRRPPATG
jgi:acyl-CoA thioester hydrolase